MLGVGVENVWGSVVAVNSDFVLWLKIEHEAVTALDSSAN
jgi:hypothetical protein